MALRVALPNKGRLSERSVQIMRQAGIEIEDGSERKLFASVKERDLEIMFLRAQDIVRFVHQGVVDAGITGKDLVLEADLDVVTLVELNYGYCRLVVAVPENTNINSVEEIKDNSTVATSFPNLTQRFFSRIGKKVKISIVSGATEVTPHIGVADLIVDLVSTGSTLRTHRLKEIATIVESNAVLIGNKESVKNKRKQIDELSAAIKSVSDAENKKYLMADVPVKALDEIKKFLPGIAGPTIMNIMGRDDVVAIHVVVDKDKVYDAVIRLKSLGATGILIVPIDRMVP
ncbi:MAG: ATP phosphoribosyltransferase [Methanomassiliicoccales archaeon]|nr:ATP phosphoribosyltransferase [Methanomassiliicoccales archaeon]